MVAELLKREIHAEHAYIAITDTSRLPLIEAALNTPSSDVMDTIWIKNLRIKIVYSPRRKMMIMNKGFVRKIWIAGELKNRLLEIYHSDDVSVKNPEELENPLIPWTIGITEDRKTPGWVEPFLFMTTSMVIIFSFFYIRS